MEDHGHGSMLGPWYMMTHEALAKVTPNVSQKVSEMDFTGN